MTSNDPHDHYDELLEIAKESIYDLETLEARNTDSLDFYDVNVTLLHDMLCAAFSLGVNTQRREAKEH